MRSSPGHGRGRLLCRAEATKAGRGGRNAKAAGRNGGLAKAAGRRGATHCGHHVLLAERRRGEKGQLFTWQDAATKTK